MRGDDRRAELLAVGAAGRAGLPDQRQARAPRRRQQLHPRHCRRRTDARRGRAARHLHPGPGSGPGRAGVGRCRCDAGARHAPRPGRRRLDPSGVVGARRPQSGPSTPSPPRPADSWRACPVPTRRSVTARRRRPTGLDEPGVTAGRITADVVGRLGLPTDAHVYLCGPPLFMAELTATFRRARLRRRPPPHRELRNPERHHSWCGRWARRAPSPPGRSAGHRAGGDVRPQRVDGALGRALRLRPRDGRGVSGAGSVVVSDRGLSHLRDQSRLRRRGLLARAGRRSGSPATCSSAAPGHATISSWTCSPNRGIR